MTTTRRAPALRLVPGTRAMVNRAVALAKDPVQAARAARLRYMLDDTRGITRKRIGKNFVYFASNGRRITNPTVVARIKSLVIPPAWTDVWISPSPHAHVQATGRDANGRKQYRYHPKFRAFRDETKYGRMIAFAEALPNIRAQTDCDLALPGLPRRKVLAAVVQLLEKTLIRVGNDEYARTNKSFGLTTMRDRHVDVSGDRVRFAYIGKSGKPHSVDLRDGRLARTVKRCRDLPGQVLFQYVDENGKRQKIGSGDVNKYLKEMAGAEFTAKDFRTWAGTVLAARALRDFEPVEKRTQLKKNVVSAIECVAKRLGNTRAVCRKCYIHPAILDAYMDGSMAEALTQRASGTVAEGQLSEEELAVLGLIQRRLAKDLQAA